jgi:hypothetical protein
MTDAELDVLEEELASALTHSENTASRTQTREKRNKYLDHADGIRFALHRLQEARRMSPPPVRIEP